MRALGTELPGLSPKKPEKRPYPPGQHGSARRKLSEYGVRLMEKQKVCINYGLTDRQLRGLMGEATRSDMATGDKLVELLERRLDNVVFRAGFARSIPAARQLVCHGHVLVDGKRVDIASYRVKRGQVVTLKEGIRSNGHVKSGADLASTREPASWLSVNKEAFSAEVTSLPSSDTVMFPLRTQLVVEFYSQLI